MPSFRALTPHVWTRLRGTPTYENSAARKQPDTFDTCAFLRNVPRNRGAYLVNPSFRSSKTQDITELSQAQALSNSFKSFKISSSTVRTPERPLGAAFPAWNMSVKDAQQAFQWEMQVHKHCLENWGTDCMTIHLKTQAYSKHVSNITTSKMCLVKKTGQ